MLLLLVFITVIIIIRCFWFFFKYHSLSAGAADVKLASVTHCIDACGLLLMCGWKKKKKV